MSERPTPVEAIASDAELSKLLFEAREAIEMLTLMVENRTGKTDNYGRKLVERIDDYRAAAWVALGRIRRGRCWEMNEVTAWQNLSYTAIKQRDEAIEQRNRAVRALAELCALVGDLPMDSLRHDLAQRAVVLEDNGSRLLDEPWAREVLDDE